MAQNTSAQSQKSKVTIAEPLVPFTSIHKVEADGVQVFYRQAGNPQAPVVLLLHGFPTSSLMYRELIPRLADRYRVVAPDLHGFGFTEVTEKRKCSYTFEALAATVASFTEAIFSRTWCRLRRNG
jgi:pimeloyl-ACP methyl ester carboxylesterase